MVAAAILYFKIFKILTVGKGKRVQLRHLAKFRQLAVTAAEIWLFFQDGGRPPSWICDACVGTTHEGI